MIPNARNNINNGTGFFTFGTFTTISIFLFVFVGATIFIENVLANFDEFSLIETICAEYRNSGVAISSLSSSCSSKISSAVSSSIEVV